MPTKMFWNRPPKAKPKEKVSMSKKVAITDTSKIVLDKPTKRVYNIRKDEKGVRRLYNTYLRDVSVIGRSAEHKTQYWLSFIVDRNKYVVDLCMKANVPCPVLAGGALRDLVWNKPPKDYDYFFNCKSSDEAYETIDKLLLVVGDYTEGGQGDGTYGIEEADFEGVYGVFNVGAGDVQLIIGVWDEDPTGESHVYHRFDLSVCQAEMPLDGEGNIYFSDNFMESLVTKEIKLLKDTPYSKSRATLQMYSLGFYSQYIQREKRLELNGPKIKWQGVPVLNL